MGKYIVLDGMDGSGKDTQVELLKKKFGETSVFTREPGGTPFAEEIRKIVVDNVLAATATALTILLLVFAAREDLLAKVIMPALRSGKNVFSNRGDSSTFAFQIFGEKHHNTLFEIFMRLRQLIFTLTAGRRPPDLYIVLDMPPSVARERAMRDSGRTKNHFDLRDIEYYERVHRGFHMFAKYAPVEYIDATGTEEEVHHLVLRALKTRLGMTEPGL